ncbi:MAG: hypothetical protein AAGH79_17270, partial [Bacteroidota bacterium]
VAKQPDPSVTPTQLIHFEEQALTFLEIQRADTTLTLQRSGGNWVVTYQNITLPAKERAAQQLVTTLRSLRAADLEKTQRQQVEMDQSTLRISLGNVNRKETFSLQAGENSCWEWLSLPKVENDLWFPIEPPICQDLPLSPIELLPERWKPRNGWSFSYVLAQIEGDSIWVLPDSIANSFSWILRDNQTGYLTPKVDPECRSVKSAKLGQVEFLAADSLPELALTFYGDSIGTDHLYFRSSVNPALCFEVDSLHPFSRWLLEIDPKPFENSFY